MDASIVDKDLIERINKGEEKAFEVLYNSYFVYLCACANSYIFNPVEAQDIVNETFAKIWYRRGELSFPIHDTCYSERVFELPPFASQP